MKEVTLQFVKERETKNTVRYEEVEQETMALAVGTLYVQKHLLKQMGNPEKLSVTISVD